jgi:hypothetical protein
MKLNKMGKRDLEQIIKVIKKVREPGEAPAQSSSSLELFECDLCKGDIEKSKMTQCAYCGRWVCKDNCWNEKNLACNSCSSVIQLAGRKEDKSYSEHDKKNLKTKKSEKKNDFFKKFRIKK